MYLMALYVSLTVVLFLVNYGYEFFTNKRYDDAGCRTLFHMVVMMIFITVIKLLSL